MKELFDIANRYDEFALTGESAALATVISTAGSTYRLAGARMLIGADGSAVGCVSGGCLEHDVVENARHVLATGRPRVVSYDTRDDETGDWSFGLGCRGRVEVFIEQLRDEPTNPVRFINRCLKSRGEGAIATIVGGADRDMIGARLLANVDGPIASSIADSRLTGQVVADIPAVFAGDSTRRTYLRADGGEADIVLERIRRPIRLIVFGCGHDCVPLVRMARELGWPTTLVDYRPRNLARARSFAGIEVVSARPTEFAERVLFDDRCAAVVMNHNYADDQTILGHLLNHPLGYVGLLGPRARTALLMAEVRPAPASRAATPGCVHGPVGLDIGAASPEEIAVSIVAEVLAVFSGRGGGHASNRVLPLHSPASHEIADGANSTSRTDLSVLKGITSCGVSDGRH